MFRFFDLGNGQWVKLCLTAKLRDRFITGLRNWVQENGKPLPLLLNTAITNAPDVVAKGADDSPARIFLKDGNVQGFSSTQEIVVTVKRNGHSRVFHARWDKEDGNNEKSIYRFKSWEEKTREPFNQAMADAVKDALKRSGQGNNSKREYEEKTRFFKKERRNPEKKKTLKEYLAET